MSNSLSCCHFNLRHREFTANGIYKELSVVDAVGQHTLCKQQKKDFCWNTKHLQLHLITNCSLRQEQYFYYACFGVMTPVWVTNDPRQYK